MSWALVLLLTTAAIFIARSISFRPALPALVTIAGYFPFVMEVQKSFARGFFILFFWTFLLSVLVLFLSWKEPERMERFIWRAGEYSSAMLRWIETGELPEGSTRQVIFFHLKQTLFYCFAAALSANFLGLLLGSALLNYMNFYVARLARNSSRPLQAFLMGWNPWSIIRVLSFLWLGIVVSNFSLRLLFSIPWRLSAALVIPPILGILLDLSLKIVLSRRWSAKLRAGLSHTS
jgi:hypothetical protein